jgi:hypothetical protein
LTLSLRTVAIDSFVGMLGDLSNVLGKGAEHAKAKKFDEAVLVGARLAPDMYSLAQQVQTACDSAKNGTARIIGKEPPRHQDNEKTIDELKARIAKTVDYLKGLPIGAFEGASDRKIVQDLQNGLELEMTGAQYLQDWALPNFYFHVVTAYDILRHNGVEVGKRDFMGHVAAYIRQRSK